VRYTRFQSCDIFHPILKPLKSHPEFEEVMQKIKDQFWQDHNKLKESLEEKGLL